MTRLPKIKIRKKHFIFITCTVLIVEVLILLNPVQTRGLNFCGAVIPEKINNIFKNSCYSCHYTGGNAGALAMLNFAEWDAYPPRKQERKSADICNAVVNGIMPPAGSLKQSPGKKLNAVQIENICNWAGSIKN